METVYVYDENIVQPKALSGGEFAIYAIVGIAALALLAYGGLYAHAKLTGKWVEWSGVKKDWEIRTR